MNIQIPQPTVLERLEKDLEEGTEQVKLMRRGKSYGEEYLIKIGFTRGLEHAIEVMKLNKD